MAWSPSACKELKRLCTRVSRKRQAKAKAPATSNDAPPDPSSVHPNHISQMFPAASGPFHPQFQGFGATSHPSTRTPPDTQQPNVFQPLSYYQQRHEAANINHRNEKTSTPPEVTTAAISEFPAPDKHTRIVSSLPKTEKAFRIPCTIRLSDKIIGLERHQTQADQGSDLNVISMGLAWKLNLELLSLDHVAFRGLTMCTADHKDTSLEFWVWLEFDVQQLWRKIRCFVSPSVINSLFSIATELLSLLLGIPWLYSVNARRSIWSSIIEIGDPSLGEEVRNVVGPELVFCQDHNLLMYPRKYMPIVQHFSEPVNSTMDVSSDSDSLEISSLDESEDKLSDVEDPVFNKSWVWLKTTQVITKTRGGTSCITTSWNGHFLICISRRHNSIIPPILQWRYTLSHDVSFTNSVSDT